MGKGPPAGAGPAQELKAQALLLDGLGPIPYLTTTGHEIGVSHLTIRKLGVRAGPTSQVVVKIM